MANENPNDMVQRAEDWVAQIEQRLSTMQVVTFDDLEEALEVIDSLVAELKTADRQIALYKAMIEGR